MSEVIFLYNYRIRNRLCNVFVSERTLSRKRVTAQISVSCKLNTQPTFEFSLQLFEFISKIGFSASICNRKGLTTRFMSNLGFCGVEFYLVHVCNLNRCCRSTFADRKAEHTCRLVRFGFATFERSLYYDKVRISFLAI